MRRCATAAVKIVARLPSRVWRSPARTAALVQIARSERQRPAEVSHAARLSATAAPRQISAGAISYVHRRSFARLRAALRASRSRRPPGGRRCCSSACSGRTTRGARSPQIASVLRSQSQMARNGARPIDAAAFDQPEHWNALAAYRSLTAALAAIEEPRFEVEGPASDADREAALALTARVAADDAATRDAGARASRDPTRTRRTRGCVVLSTGRRSCRRAQWARGLRRGQSSGSSVARHDGCGARRGGRARAPGSPSRCTASSRTRSVRWPAARRSRSSPRPRPARHSRHRRLHCSRLQR